MTITIEFGWWMLPVVVSLGNMVWILWPRPGEWRNAGAYSWPLGTLMLPVRSGLAAITTLIALIVWRW